MRQGMMKNYLSNLDRRYLPIVREIGNEAGKMQLAAYIVGGIVRDILLRKKILDLDIVVEGDAIAFAKVLVKKWKSKLTVYGQFGTASLQAPDGLHVDFATARKERYIHSGALPTVQPGSLHEDLFRRDFTINAMAIAIHPDSFGQLTDPLGGLSDLSKKRIKVLHGKSFIDDPTRILRAVRFEQRLCFHMEKQTRLWMTAALKGRVLTNIKPARYFAEFKKMLSEADPLKCLRRLNQLGGLRFLDPDFSVNVRSLSRLHQRIEKARRMPLFRQDHYWLVYFMVLLAGSENRVSERVLKKFPFTKTERVSIRQGRDINALVKKLSSEKLLRSQVYRILRSLNRETILYAYVRTSCAVVHRHIDRFLSEDIHAKLRISGEDLKRAGIAPGRRMGKMLEDVLYLKIDGQARNKREELKAALLS
jgi:tRNA nucleotidyltransferase (CCA-adding enzyme)